jgi:hypothetical protein
MRLKGARQAEGREGRARLRAEVREWTLGLSRESVIGGREGLTHS